MKDLYDDIYDAQTAAARVLDLARIAPRSTGQRRNLHAEIACTAPTLAEFVLSPRTQAALRVGAWLLSQLGLDESEPSADEISHAIETLGNSSIPDAIAATGLRDA